MFTAYLTNPIVSLVRLPGQSLRFVKDCVEQAQSMLAVPVVVGGRNTFTRVPVPKLLAIDT